MEKKLVIVFAKNIVLGKVKTRLAKTVGDTAAFNVYKHLIDITQEETRKMKDCDVHIYFSDVIINGIWPNQDKFVQKGNDLGERMQHAFQQSFDKGYTHIVGVGTDLPDLTAEIIQQGLGALQKTDAVFGPSEDGGYYLIGMNKMVTEIFNNKPWSTDTLLDLTVAELNKIGIDHTLLQTLNDVDTVEDLENSSIASRFEAVLELVKA
ncbi:MAG: TIGR04282 family arsenosugar biosynthesis glycosyltransferase [Crocinitomicaceae bacterium]|nr:TIGR04282 family arsenosugar biosynthesis glycosyltransferase [Crocinitomicaceae bacterium]